MTKLAELKKNWMKDPEFRRGYEDARTEFLLSEALIAARAKAKLSQEEVAQRLNTTQSAIARLESGRAYPSLRTLHRYANAVGAEVKVQLISHAE